MVNQTVDGRLDLLRLTLTGLDIMPPEQRVCNVACEQVGVGLQRLGIHRVAFATLCAASGWKMSDFLTPFYFRRLRNFYVLWLRPHE
jgi:hypothetical protein